MPVSLGGAKPATPQGQPHDVTILTAGCSLLCDLVLLCEGGQQQLRPATWDSRGQRGSRPGMARLELLGTSPSWFLRQEDVLIGGGGAHGSPLLLPPSSLTRPCRGAHAADNPSSRPPQQPFCLSQGEAWERNTCRLPCSRAVSGGMFAGGRGDRSKVSHNWL